MALGEVPSLLAMAFTAALGLPKGAASGFYLLARAADTRFADFATTLGEYYAEKKTQGGLIAVEQWPKIRHREILIDRQGSKRFGSGAEHDADERLQRKDERKPARA